MKEIVGIYKKQYLFIESSLTSMMDSIDLSQYDGMATKSIFTLLPAMKATYKINKELKQSTPPYTLNMNLTLATWGQTNLTC